MGKETRQTVSFLFRDKGRGKTSRLAIAADIGGSSNSFPSNKKRRNEFAHPLSTKRQGFKN